MTRQFRPLTQCRIRLCALLFALVMGLATPAFAQQQGQKRDAGQQASAGEEEALTTAVLDFQVAKAISNAKGSDIATTFAAQLNGQPGVKLVERQRLQQALEEHALSDAGLVDPGTATEIGQLIGAELLVTGRVFALGQQAFVTAKIIGTDTSLVDVISKQGDPAKIGQLTMEAGMQITQRVQKRGSELLPDSNATNPVPALQKQLKGRELPTVTIVVAEKHRPGAPAPRETPDPAVETELRKLLGKAGFTLKDVDRSAVMRAYGSGARPNAGQPLKGMSEVDLVLIGEAFSEFGGQVGQLVSCSARAELNVINRENQTIRLSDRATTQGIALSEDLAGKNALQKAGWRLAIAVLRDFAKEEQGH